MSIHPTELRWQRGSNAPPPGPTPARLLCALTRLPDFKWLVSWGGGVQALGTAV